VTPTSTPRIITRSEHIISRAHISSNALRVLYRLRDAGFMAFLVGGCVRDLLIGIEPKDFDVATDALPEQVRKLFRNCRLVGRRFRLAHVFFGREIIEVATFRAASAPAPGEEPLPDADSAEGEDADPEQEGLDAAGSEIASLEDGEASLDSSELDDDEGDEEDDDDEDEDDLGDDAGHSPPSPPRSVARNSNRYRERPALPNGDESAADLDVDPNAERMFDETGRILRDNVYGTIDADVWRRDLTANALYYNIADFSIWDYVGGFEDVAARKLKLIGDPETRFREDPVRMLRAARFEAKLSFEIDPATAEPIERLKGLLAAVPPARLFDETLKLFLTGHGRRSFEVLRHRGLLAALLPSVDDYFRKHPGSLVEQLVMRGLENTDSRVMADKPVTPTFLFALLLYGPIASIIESTPPERWHELGTILDACDRAARQVQLRISLPKRFSLGMREMFALQPRLEHPRGRRALRVIEHPRFRAAYDLLLLRAEYGLASAEIAQWWTRIQEVSPEERGQMADALTGQTQQHTEGAPRRGGRRRRRRRGPSSPG
jgi:poly(A) polymerase